MERYGREVTELMSILVPLETLSGWPSVANPSPLEVLALLVGAPLVVVAAIFLVSKLRPESRSGHGTSAEDADPVWVGAPDRREIGVDEDAQAAIEAGHQTEPEDAGGASARW